VALEEGLGTNTMSRHVDGLLVVHLIGMQAYENVRLVRNSIQEATAAETPLVRLTAAQDPCPLRLPDV
jgi:hypothetical protein